MAARYREAADGEIITRADKCPLAPPDDAADNKCKHGGGPACLPMSLIAVTHSSHAVYLPSILLLPSFSSEPRRTEGPRVNTQTNTQTGPSSDICCLYFIIADSQKERSAKQTSS